MKKYEINKKLLCAVIIAALVTVAGVCFRIWFAQNYLENETLFIDLDAPKLFYNFVLCFLAAIGSAAVYFTTENKTADYSTVQNSGFKAKAMLTRVIEFVLALLFAVVFVSYIGDFSSIGSAGYATGTLALPIAKAAGIFKLIICPICVVFWLVLTFTKGKKLTAIALLSNAPTLWFAMCLLIYFVETSSYVNRFGRNMEVICYIICIIFLLNETRAYFTTGEGQKADDEQVVNMRAYNVLSFCASYACFLKASVFFETSLMNVENADLVIRMGLDSGIERTIVIFFGCYAFSKLLNGIVFEKGE